jgi:hypothetical protein
MEFNLEFNTSTKEAKVYLGVDPKTREIYKLFTNVPTIKPREGYYEIMGKQEKDGVEVQIPKMRLPIQLTVMEIIN